MRWKFAAIIASFSVTETCKRVIEYAFKELSVKRIVTPTEKENPGSINLLKRLGFKIQKNLSPWGGVVGILPNHMI
ncbi:GNAT family N-acetyltransferase [Candidatus Poribacteria bacterium]|nr:GNAT family N-acetyltransferase [Candidatus Poribacteria bacterium]